MPGAHLKESDVEATTARKRILVFALHYPPSPYAAAIRARNLVRNLQALGHDVQVITPRSRVDAEPPPEARALRWFDVENLARRAARREQRANRIVPPPRPWQRGLRSVAARALVPDLYVSWIPVACLAARSDVRDADMIISTGGASAHVVARLVARSKPTVVDINDLWWRNPRSESGAIRDRVDHFLEKQIINSATALIVPVTEQGSEVTRRWGRSATAVPTGFDPSDFPPHNRDQERGTQREILFAGTLYENFQLDLIFEALAEGRATHGWAPERLRFSFIGSGSGTALAAARAHDVEAFVEGTPLIARQDLLARLVTADALLLPLYAEDPHHLPMRFFEFVGSGRPLIGIGSPDVPAGRLIVEHDLGVVCATAEEVVAAVGNIVSAPRRPDLPPETQALFELSSYQPTLQHLVDKTTGIAGIPQPGRDETG